MKLNIGIILISLALIYASVAAIWDFSNTLAWFVAGAGISGLNSYWELCCSRRKR
jgi:hypothetical protein